MQTDQEITIHVETSYIEAQSAPDEDQYAFSYTITIHNTGTEAAKLLNRHWVITDANGKVQEVSGDGVVGEQPHLNPGEEFQYSSGAVLETPVGAMQGAGARVLELIRRLRDELRVNTTCGASNISFGLPNRHGLNPTFLAMAIGAGLTSAITNPLEAPLMQAVRGSDVLLGHDAQCAAWIAAYRDPGRAGGRVRRSKRRRRPGGG